MQSSTVGLCGAPAPLLKSPHFRALSFRADSGGCCAPGPRSVLVNQPRRSSLEIALLGNTRGPTRRGFVAVAGSRVLTGRFEQMCADCVEAVMVHDALVVVE